MEATSTPTTDVGKNLENAMREFIASYGTDTAREDLKETPKRFVKQLRENLVGYSDDPEKHIKVFSSDDYSDLITVSDITFSSLCEHHMVPFFGTIDIAYIPNGKILGLSKFARLADALSRRLQVQEHLTQQIADLVEQHLSPKFLIVRIGAKHTCMSTRGVRRHNSNTETIAVRGDLHAYTHYLQRFYMHKGGQK